VLPLDVHEMGWGEQWLGVLIVLGQALM